MWPSFLDFLHLTRKVKSLAETKKLYTYGTSYLAFELHASSNLFAKNNQRKIKK
jgi:hypothetical protein